MSQKPRKKGYPLNVPEKINPDEYLSLKALLEETFKNYANYVAFENMGVQITYKDLDHYSQKMAIFFRERLRMVEGDRIAIQLPNILQFPVVLCGAIRAGLIVVNVNPLYTPSEMKHQFNDAGVKTIVILSNFAANLESILSETSVEHIIITQLGDMLGRLKGTIVNFVVKKIKKLVPKYNISGSISFKEILKKTTSQPFYKEVNIQSSDVAFLQYTGGTTGVSKGAMLTHRNVVANLEQVFAWLIPSGLKSKEETFITALPLYHIFALTANFFVCMKLGSKNVLITNPRDMKGYLKELKKHPYTLITGVNTLFNGMLLHSDFDKVDHSHLKVAIAGGMALQKSVLERWKKRTGITIAEGYGLTETAPVVAVNPLDGNVKIGTIGLPVPNTDVILIDDDNNEVPCGKPGELCIKGPQVMKGYWQNQKETDNSFYKDYFKSGDVAILQEDGFIKIVDRKKEMILVSGFNVYPNEVDDCVASIEGVAEVATIGVPDAKTGEAVKVYIITKPNITLAKEKVIDHCKKHLAKYKCPKHIAYTDTLPKSNVGKILRRILKEKDLKENQYA